MNQQLIYRRVVPRDFFNESKLLKCMGQLFLKILNNQVPEGTKLTIFESSEPFDIREVGDGHLTVKNYGVLVNDKPVLFKSVYNSRENYPFLADWELTEYTVFDDDGNWDEEFLNLCKMLK